MAAAASASSLTNGTIVTFPFSPNYTFIWPFELAFDKEYHREWMRRNWSLSVYLSVFYVGIIFGIQLWMKSRPPYNVRSVFFVWNVALSVFSFVGAYRTLPELFHVLSNYGIHYTICSRSYVESNKIAGFWAWIFTLSKTFELVDTIFIVLRKQKLLFIHWSHHISALLTSWYIYSDHPAMGRLMMTANYSVHATMYAYFALRAARVTMPRPVAMAVTISQILQMVLCFVASLYTFVVKSTSGDCGLSWNSALTIFAVYGTFFTLFVKLFIGNYLNKDKMTAKSSTKKID